MLRRAAVPLAVVLFAAGCTTQTPAGAPPSPTVTAAPPSAPAPSAAAPAATESAIGDPGDAGMLAGLGDQADWMSLVENCPNEGQKPVIQKVVTEDVTGDGTADAVVARSCEASTSYFPSAVEIFDGTSPSADPRRVDTLLKEVWVADNPWLTGLRVSDGMVVIEAHGASGKQGNACADRKLTYHYRFTGGKFEKAERKAVEAKDCLPVG